MWMSVNKKANYSSIQTASLDTNNSTICQVVNCWEWRLLDSKVEKTVQTLESIATTPLTFFCIWEA